MTVIPNRTRLFSHGCHPERSPLRAEPRDLRFARAEQILDRPEENTPDFMAYKCQFV